MYTTEFRVNNYIQIKVSCAILQPYTFSMHDAWKIKRYNITSGNYRAL